jgi:hypothetical protein
MPCPMTEQEIKDYFFSLIQRTPETYANDFVAVMDMKYPWNGQMLQIPENIPGPGQRLPSDAPFYGITQQVRAGGVSAGRIWVPAAVPQTDENGNQWFTRYIQIIKDKPFGQQGVDLLWDWKYESGNAYVPICSGSNPGPGPGPNPDCCEELAARYVALEERVTKLEQNLGFPKRVALKSLANGKIVAAEINSTRVLVANRDGIGPWEQFELIVLE